MLFRSKVVGVGSYLPERVLLNEELAQRIDTTDDWIVERTGIRQRHIAAPGEVTSDLGAAAANKALEAAGLKAKDIDCIIVATTTPDHHFPSCATRIQAKIGAVGAFAFDVQAVCSGFIYALTTADNFIRLGQAKNVIVIGAETMSQLLDWQDRTTCILFGDGAGAVVLQASSVGENPYLNNNNLINNSSAGILSSHLFSDGRHYDWLYVDRHSTNNRGIGHIKMNGREIFKNAIDKIGQAVQVALDHNRITAADVDWFVPHQANQRILKGVCERFTIPLNKMVVTIDKHANTSAASIPLALDIAVRDGRIKGGDLVLLEAMGGGLTWASALIRW